MDRLSPVPRSRGKPIVASSQEKSGEPAPQHSRERRQIPAQTRAALQTPLLARPINATWVDAAFAIVVAVFVGSGPLVRIGGGAPFFLFVCVAAAYATATRSWRFEPALLALTSLGAIYVFLSYVGLMPSGWSRFREAIYIPQQASFVFAFYPMVMAAERFWKYLIAHRNRGLLLVGLAACGSIVGRLSVLALSGADPTIYEVSAANNNELFLYIAMLYGLYLSRSWMIRSIAILCLIGCLFATSFAQVMIVFPVALVMAVSPFPRITAAGFVATLLSIWTWGIFNLAAVWHADANSGVRLLFARDAFESIVETNGIGVGFGTEAIRNIYPEFAHRHINWYNSYSQFMLTGLHNSFVGVPFRLGVIGGFIMIWLFFWTCFPRSGPLPISRFLSMLYSLLVITLFVNVSLESPTYSMAVAFMLALLLIGRSAAATQGSTAFRVHLNTLGPARLQENARGMLPLE
jgi:hypothetical protein